MQVNERRRGYFRVSMDLLKDLPPKFFSNFIIFKAEVIYFGRIIEYYAYSNLFRELSEGEAAPHYVITMNSVNNSIWAKEEVNTYEKDLENKVRELATKVKKLEDELKKAEENKFKACKAYYFIVKDSLKVINKLLDEVPQDTLTAGKLLFHIFYTKHRNSLEKIDEAGKKYEEDKNV